MLSSHTKNLCLETRGVAIYLLASMPPWEGEVRATADGWVSPCTWVKENYFRFLPFLPREDSYAKD